MLIKLNLDEILIKPFSGVIKLLYKISDAGVYVLVMGLLCGFPMGARKFQAYCGKRRKDTDFDKTEFWGL